MVLICEWQHCRAMGHLPVDKEYSVYIQILTFLFLIFVFCFLALVSTLLLLFMIKLYQTILYVMLNKSFGFKCIMLYFLFVVFMTGCRLYRFRHSCSISVALAVVYVFSKKTWKIKHKKIYPIGPCLVGVPLVFLLRRNAENNIAKTGTKSYCISEDRRKKRLEPRDDMK